MSIDKKQQRQKHHNIQYIHHPSITLCVVFGRQEEKQTKLKPNMMSKNVSFSAIMATLLSAPAAAFMPSRPSHATARKSSLSMSAALIVQNKGGGHGELGKLNEQFPSIKYPTYPIFNCMTFKLI